MKKHLSLIVRLLVALAGLWYIALHVDWSDHVQLPAGTMLADGWTLDKPTLYPLAASPTLVDGAICGNVTIAIPPATPDQPPTTLTLPAESIGPKADQAHWRPGLGTTLKYARLGWLLLGLLLVFPIYPIQAFRWRMLLKVRGMDVPVAQSFKLLMVGCFFNYCMPGSTGGDLVKAVYASRGTEHRADAIMTVVFDRIVGLLALVLLAALAGLMYLQNPLARQITMYVWLAAGGVIAVSAFYFSKRLRQASGLDSLLNRLGQSSHQTQDASAGMVHKIRGLIAKVDAAAVAYRDHKMTVLWTILMSVPVQFCLAMSTAAAGYALGMKTDWLLMLSVVPVLILVQAVPISYQGFGLMEGAALAMLVQPGVATANQVVVMLLLMRIFQVVYSLIGAIFLLKGDIHIHPHPPQSEPLWHP